MPFIVRGPGVKANSWRHTRVVGYDLYPTFAEWAGIAASKLPKTLEGGSIAPLIANGGKGESPAAVFASRGLRPRSRSRPGGRRW